MAHSSPVRFKQALEKKLAVARATLAMPLEESYGSADATEGLFDIREEYDEAMHGPTADGTARPLFP